MIRAYIVGREQWENMSENLTYSSWYHTVGSHREDSGRVSQLEFRVPPNTEDEEDSDYPDTDGMLAKKVGRMPVRRDVRQETVGFRIVQ